MNSLMLMAFFLFILLIAFFFQYLLIFISILIAIHSGPGAATNYFVYVFNSLTLLYSLYDEVISKTLMPATEMKSCDAVYCGMQAHSAHTWKSLWFCILEVGCL